MVDILSPVLLGLEFSGINLTCGSLFRSIALFIFCIRRPS